MTTLCGFGMCAPGEQLRMFEGISTQLSRSPSVRTAALSPAVATISCGCGTCVQVKNCVYSEGDNGSIYAVAFSPDGSTLASRYCVRTCCSVVGCACQASSIRILKGHTAAVNAVAFSPDSSTLASGGMWYTDGSDYTVRLWDVRTGKQLRRYGGAHRLPSTSVAFSPDGRTLASGSNDNSMRLWDVRTGEPATCSEGHGHTVRSVIFSPDGRILANGGDDKYRTTLGRADDMSYCIRWEDTLAVSFQSHSVLTVPSLPAAAATPPSGYGM